MPLLLCEAEDDDVAVDYMLYVEDELIQKDPTVRTLTELLLSLLFDFPFKVTRSTFII